jgi:magnesium transporter
MVVDESGKVDVQPELTWQDLDDRNDRFIWIDCTRTDDPDFRAIAEHFGFHDLAVEDALKGGQRAKVDNYGNDFFMVVYALEQHEASFAKIELHLFAGDGYLVTIHDGDIRAIENLEKRWRAWHKLMSEPKRGMVIYSILDALVDDYFPILDEIGEDMERLETEIFTLPEHEARQRIFARRHELLLLRRIISAERDVVNELIRRDLPIFSDEVHLHLSDVYDHLLRAFEWIESYRDQHSTLLDLLTTATANKLNKIMKTMTASSIILMSASLIAGIYGMNFTHMPELDWTYGYAYALALMAGLVALLLVFFRRRDWF